MTALELRLIFYGIVAATLISAGAWVSYRWHEAETIRLEDERNAAQQDAAAKGERADSLQEDFDASEEISQKRGRTIAAQQRKLELFQRQLNKPPTTFTQPAKDWLLGDIPDDIRRLRRTDAGCDPDPNVPCPNGVVGNDSGTANGGSNGAGVSGGGKAPEGSATSLQR